MVAHLLYDRSTLARMGRLGETGLRGLHGYYSDLLDITKASRYITAIMSLSQADIEVVRQMIRDAFREQARRPVTHPAREDVGAWLLTLPADGAQRTAAELLTLYRAREGGEQATDAGLDVRSFGRLLVGVGVRGGALRRGRPGGCVAVYWREGARVPRVALPRGEARRG